jgi:long-chain acyl-CoA synthetase
MKPRRLLQDSLLATAQAHPERVALVTESQSYRYGELLDASLRLARGLQDLGLGRGERVAIHMENGWASAVAIYGTLLAGGVLMVLHPQTKLDKLRYILHDSEASVWLTEARLAGWLAWAKRGTLKGVVVDDPDSSVSGDFWRFNELLSASPPALADPGTIPLDLAALIYTSGTTGEPKGVMMSHGSMVFTLGSVLEYLGLRPDDRILSPLAFAFSYGLYQLFMAVEVGAALLVGRATFPAQIAQRIFDEQATVFPSVPTVFGSLLALYRSGLRLPSIRCVTNAAAALPVAFVPELQALFPNARVFSMYGQTECKRVCYLEPELLAHKPDSVGRAIPGTEVFLLSEAGEPVLPGEAGVLHVRGPHVMMGYWGQPERSAQLLKPGRYPGERVLCTGDHFRMDEAGLLYFVSRSDDIIKTRGEKVSPTEIEGVLYELPGVLEAAVIGVPDALLGESVRAYVVPEPGAILNEREVKRACMVRLEAVKVPQEVLFVSELPKTASGKIRRQSLREPAYT